MKEISDKTDKVPACGAVRDFAYPTYAFATLLRINGVLVHNECTDMCKGIIVQPGGFETAE